MHLWGGEMADVVPKGKWQRSWTSGKTVAKIGGKKLRFLAKQPFMKAETRQEAKDVLDKETAEILFNGLSLLKGTALKLAQTLSLEFDMLPESVCKELEKSYNQVPPLNAALVRKIISNELAGPPEELFGNFNNRALAAASLGQVHFGRLKSGESVAVKIQYPGIAQTITSDMQMARSFVKPLRDNRLLLPVLEEVEERLKEEVDYIQEARNLQWFAQYMALPDVQIPKFYSQLSSSAILTMGYIDGIGLNSWMASAPSQEERDRVANQLYKIFLYGLYDLRCIHADPNPGNFIIKPDKTIGLLDFGCVKHLDAGFVETYRQFPTVLVHGQKNDYIRLLRGLKLLKPGLSEEAEINIIDAYHPISQWFAQLYREDTFDFGASEDFFLEGRQHFKNIRKFRKYLGDIDPSFVFLDRTRYGLMRLFQKMGARVRIHNSYEYI